MCNVTSGRIQTAIVSDITEYLWLQDKVYVKISSVSPSFSYSLLL